MNMITLTTEQLRARAKDRPQGYIADVLARAEYCDGVIVRLPLAQWKALRAKYAPDAPAAPRQTLAPAPALAGQAAIAAARFAICKSCPDARDHAFRCRFHTGCCFGRWRATPEHQCPQGRWPAADQASYGKGRP